MIELINVTKNYLDKEHFCGIKDINLSFKSGMHAIIGKSGAGKSTLIHTIGSLLRPSSGQVLIDGLDIYSLNDEKLSKFRNLNFGYVFQSFYLEETYTVYRNVELPLIIRGIKERREIIEEALKQFDVFDKRDCLVKTLSGGEKQRVALARAIVGSPKYLLCDEPTGNLDVKNGKMVVDYLREIADKGILVILITHNIEDSKRADYVHELSDGMLLTHES